MLNYITKSKSSLVGLSVYLYYSIFGSVTLVGFLSLIMGIASLITGNPLVYTLFVGISIIGPPYVVLIGMSGDNYKMWERYQLCMPISRTMLVKSQYLNMGLASLIGVPPVIILTLLAYTSKMDMFQFTFIIELINSLSYIAIPLILVSLLFPLSCLSWFEEKQDGLAVICFIIAYAIPLLISFIGYRLNWAEGVSSILSLVLSLFFFATSYSITRKIYSNSDF